MEFVLYFCDFIVVVKSLGKRRFRLGVALPRN